MPSTTPDNFEYEGPPQVAEDLGRTLHGGEFGGSPILAEQVQSKFVATDSAISDVDSRVTTIENDGILGWTYITHGTVGGVADFDIDLTDGGRLVAGEFDLVRFYIRHDLDAVGNIFCRINADQAGGDGYLYALNVREADGDLAPGLSGNFQTASWNIGHGSTVSTNNLVCTIFHTQGNFNHNFQGTSIRNSTSANSMRYGEHWGNVSGLAATPSFLRIIASSGATQFNNAWFWCEGFRTP